MREPLFAGKTRQELLDYLQFLPSDMELFDMVRAPRVLTEPDEVLRTTTLLTESGLSEDLSCPICMGTYRTVMVVKDCLHRFCSECIQKWLRSGKQVCPKCRIHIPSRRSLRGDPIFERMVRRLFPDVKAFEAENDSMIAKANRRRSHAADADDNPPPMQYTNSTYCHDLRKVVPKVRASPPPPPKTNPIDGNVENSQEGPPKKRRGRPPGSGSLQRAKAAALARQLEQNQYLDASQSQEEIIVICSPNPNCRTLQDVNVKEIRVRPTKTVDMIISWLRTKLGRTDADFQLSVDGDPVTLAGDLTMGELNTRLNAGPGGQIHLILSTPHLVAPSLHLAPQASFLSTILPANIIGADPSILPPGALWGCPPQFIETFGLPLPSYDESDSFIQGPGDTTGRNQGY